VPDLPLPMDVQTFFVSWPRILLTFLFKIILLLIPAVLFLLESTKGIMLRDATSGEHGIFVSIKSCVSSQDGIYPNHIRI
jgi:hypothetical protein